LFFGEDEQFDKLVFTSSSYAFEIDNLVIKVADVDKQVAAPGTFALFGFVIAALGWSRRRFQTHLFLIQASCCNRRLFYLFDSLSCKMIFLKAITVNYLSGKKYISN
jgi:hypothetical protein